MIARIVASLAALLVLLSASAVQSQHTLSTPPSLYLVVRGAPVELDAEALRGGLAEQLAVSVELVAEDAARAPRLEVAQVGPQLVLRFYGGAGVLERTTDAPADPREWQLVATLLGASLVRDESSLLLAMLTPPPPAVPVAHAAVRAAPVVARALAHPPRPHLGAGIDLFPGVGFSSVYGGSERRNFSFGVLGDLYGGLDGYALGVFFTAGGDVAGVQHSLGVAAAERVEGAQLGLVNVAAEDVHGAQIGFVNVAGGRVHGLQLGVVNIAERADAGIGILNFYARGRTHLEVTGDSAGSFRASIKHGSGPWHTLYSIGVNPFYGDTVFLAGVGFGGRATFHELVFLDVDVFTHYTFDTRVQIGISFITGARILAGLRVVPELAIVFGVGVEVHNTSDPTTPVYAPVLGTVFDNDVRLWPTLILGLQAF